jgi:uncharacterized membrane protein
MNFSSNEVHPNNPEELPPARRRRAKRLIAPIDIDERASFLDDLAHNASPCFDFYILSLISGLIISIGFTLDHSAIIILGAALAPILAPAIGLSLGTITGAAHVFLRSLVGIFIGSLLVFLAGWLIGSITRNMTINGLHQVYYHAQVSWINFLVLAISTVLTTITFARSGKNGSIHHLALTSVALAYELYSPIAASGFGLGKQLPHLFPDGLVVFAVHLAWCAFLGALTLSILGFRPLTLFGYTLGGVVALFSIILIIGMSGAGAVIGAQLGLPTATPTLTPTITPTLTVTPSPIPPTPTFTSTHTLTPTYTPTLTFTPSPTPIYATVRTDLPEGVRFRAEPDGETIGFLANDSIIIILPETQASDGIVWVRIITSDGKEGWIVRSLITIVTVTPSP